MAVKKEQAMTQVRRYIAVDLGAESGRVMLGSICDDKLSLEEIHRFGNGPIKPSAQGPRPISPRPWAGGLRWDFDRLLSEVKTGIGKAAKKTDKLAPAREPAWREAKAGVAGIGVDSWGVDFGLIGDQKATEDTEFTEKRNECSEFSVLSFDCDQDASVAKNGKLLENPYHYRDSRTNGMMEKAFALMGKRRIYECTGIQFMQLNSVYQLLAMRLSNSPVLAKTKTLIFIGDLFSYYLCDRAFGEYTLASTSQLMDMRTGKWSQEMFDKLSLPIEIMPDIIQPGTVVGKLAKTIAQKLGCGQIPVIAVASHDTASAVAAVPAGENNWAYLSSGTWSLMGVEVPKAIVNDKTFQYEFTNEGGVENTIRLLKNIMGLWLVQECKRQWEREGVELSYDQLTEMAQEAKPFAACIEVDRSEFLAPGDMPKRINDYLVETGQKIIVDKGQMIRAILEALAFKYRTVIERIEDVTGKKIDCLHIVGGGMKNELLNQFAADATGKKIIAGPAEATAIGNILMQAKATGQIKTLTEARKVVRNSFELKEYEPHGPEQWQKEYGLIAHRYQI